jgi:succinate-semialdehyde dehydrogenase/glutarate-semialdehyde dehydrogenase
MFIGGQRVGALSGRIKEVRNPATGSIVDTIPWGTAEDVDQAVADAARAFATWSRLPQRERGRILSRASDTIDARGEAIAALLTAEQGKPLAEARNEVMRLSEQIRWYAEMADKIFGEQVPLADARQIGLTLREPLGVVGAIVPWNYPLTLARNKLAPALAAGNTMLLKPASTTPLSTLAVAEALVEGGLPPGVLNVVVGAQAGEDVVRHPLVRKIGFTGSTASGKRVMAAAAATLKKVVLELGGSDPCIVLDDADLDAAVPAIMSGRFANCGQTCRAVKRLYVQSGVYEELLRRLAQRVAAIRIGNGADAGVAMGPMHTPEQRNEVERQIADAVSRGASVVHGGARPSGPEFSAGWFLQPTLIAGAPDESRVLTEEVFGPCLPVVPIADLEEGLRRANTSAFALGASIWTRDITAAWRAARAFESGFVWVNAEPNAPYKLPFGGIKESGLGRENGIQGLLDYTEVKSVVFGGLAA